MLRAPSSRSGPVPSPRVAIGACPDTDSMDVIMDLIESNCHYARMRAMRTLYARDADAICARDEIRPSGGATLGGLREMQRRRTDCGQASRAMHAHDVSKHRR